MSSARNSSLFEAFLLISVARASGRKRGTCPYLRNKEPGFFSANFTVLKANPVDFASLLRLQPEDFDYLIEALGSRIVPSSPNKCMVAHERLLVTLQ